MTPPIQVNLKDILEGMDFQSDETTAYLHRPTARVVVVSDEALRMAEVGPGQHSGLHERELADARGVLAGANDYLPLPDRFDIDEYRMLERFAAGIADLSAREQVRDALRGSGAFRRFKDAVRQLGLTDDWYGYRDRGYDEVARAWCEQHGILVAPLTADA